jgi:hypothetical protein
MQYSNPNMNNSDNFNFAQDGGASTHSNNNNFGDLFGGSPIVAQSSSGSH